MPMAYKYAFESIEIEDEYAPLRLIAPGVYDTLSSAIDEAGNQHTLLPDIHVTTYTALSFGAFVLADNYMAIYARNLETHGHGTGISVPNQGDWMWGNELYSAAHIGRDHDYLDLNWQPALLMPSLDATGNQPRDHSTVALVVNKTALDGLYIAQRHFVPKETPDGSKAKVFDRDAYLQTNTYRRT